MKRILLSVFLLLTTLSFAEMQDRIGLLDSEDRLILNEKIENLEKESKLDIDIIIDEDSNRDRADLKIDKNHVIVYITRISQSRYKVSMMFTKDINVIAYREEIDRLMDDLSNLFNGEMYTDITYEIVGNISSVIKLIELEKKEIIRNKKIMFFSGVLKLLITLFFLVIILLVVRNRVKNRVHKCKYCHLKMELIDEYDDGDKHISMYSCKVCGFSKKVTGSRG